MKLRRSYSGLSRGGKAAFILAAALFVYGVIGFVVVPPVVRSQTMKYLEAKLGRRVMIQKVRFNPFALSATVSGVQIGDHDGSDFLAWDHAHANLQLSSIVDGGPVFRDLRLTGPYFHLRILPDGTLNVSDIPEAFASPDKAPDDAESEPAPLQAMLVQIEHGRFLFSDHSRPTPFRYAVGPVDLTLTDFATLPDVASNARFAATTEAGERFVWEGSITIAPPASTGKITIESFRPRTGWRYFQDDVQFEITEGALDAEIHYRAALAEGRPALTIEGSALTLEDFRLVASDTDKPIVEIPRLAAGGIDVDLLQRSVEVATIELDDARLRGWIREDGRPHYTTLLADSVTVEAAETAETVEAAETDPATGRAAARPADSAPPDSTTPGSTTASTGDEAAWTFGVAKLDVAGLGLEFEDRSTPSHARFALHPVTLSASNLTNEAGAVADVDLALTLNGSGTLALRGRASITPPWAELDVALDQIPLAAFAPHVAAAVPVQITSGGLSAEASVAYRPSSDDGLPLLATRGAISIDDLATRDATADAELLSWERLALVDFTVDLEPSSVHVARVDLAGATAKLVVLEDGRSNLAALAAAGRGDHAERDHPKPAAIPIAVDTIALDGVALSVTDRSVDPKFDFSMSELSGTVAGLSSTAGARADVDLEARVQRTGKLRVEGQINPLADEAYTDLRIALTNLDLGGFSPYSGRYVGRTISAGRLSLDLDYELSEDVLVGSNGVEIDAFGFGRRVASPDATTLPVGLAMALLKDASGRIDFDLPVRGDLNDPEFSLLAVILEGLVNLVTKVAASPFNLVGRLVPGGGEGLDFVAFEAGAATAHGRERDKLGRLAKALDARPALGLEIFGIASRTSDVDGLRRRRLDARLRAMRFAEVEDDENASASADELVLEPRDRAKLVERLYRETFDAKPKELRASLPEPPPHDEKAWLLAEAERRLRESIAVTDTDLEDLARTRAVGIAEALAGEGVASARVFIVESTVDEGTRPVRCDLVLIGL